MNVLLRERMVQRRTFRAMGCPITLTAIDSPEARFAADAHELAALAETWEARFSRFRPESELSRLNAFAGTGALRVDPILFDMIALAVSIAHQSLGAFNPLVLPALLGSGYDRTFREVEARSEWQASSGSPVPGIEAITLDRDARTVALAAGAQIDLGGIAKGAFVDAAFALVAERWPGGCLNVGGDLRLWGAPPDGDAWLTGIEDPLHPERDLAIAKITDPRRAGAIATSGRNRRRWRTDRGTAHHLIDPRTGEPARGAIETATAFAANATTADIAAKLLFLSISRDEPAALFGAALGITIDDRGCGTRWEGDARDALEIIPTVVWTDDPA
jgi:FAD:protein FMN transferase